MGPGVRRSELQAVGQALVNLELQCIEVRDALSLIRDGVHVVSGIGYADGRIAAEFVRKDRFAVQEQRGRTAVGTGLPVHHIGGCGNEWLVEGNGKHQMRAVTADITGLDDPAVGGLKLKVERPVLHIRQFVVDIVAAKQKRTKKITRRPASRKTASGLLKVGKGGLE